jgi:hypothetical protein
MRLSFIQNIIKSTHFVFVLLNSRRKGFFMFSFILMIISITLKAIVYPLDSTYYLPINHRYSYGSMSCFWIKIKVIVKLANIVL